MKMRFIILSVLAIVLIIGSSFAPKNKFKKGAPVLNWIVNNAAGSHRTVSIFKIYSPTITYTNTGGFAPGSSNTDGYFYPGDYGRLAGTAELSGATTPGDDLVEVYDINNTLISSQIVSNARQTITLRLTWLAYYDELRIEITPH